MIGAVNSLQEKVMTFSLGRAIIAILVAALVGLILVDLVGPFIVDLHAGPFTDIGRFLEGPAGWLIAILIGVWFYLRGPRVGGF